MNWSPAMVNPSQRATLPHGYLTITICSPAIS